MTKPFSVLAAAVAVLAICCAADAQLRGGVSSVRGPSVRLASSRTSIVSSRPSQLRPAVHISPAGSLRTRFSTFANSISFTTTNGVPGLGFDYPHLAAISGGLRNSRNSRSGRGFHRGENNFIPIWIGGYPYSYDYGDLSGDTSADGPAQPQYQPPPQPQVIVVQQPVPAAQQLPDSGNDAVISPAPPPAEPVRDVGEFDLVRRDGRVLFASAFMVTGTQLSYVTPEGFRRTIAVADLDIDATRQMNEARGTTVQIHN